MEWENGVLGSIFVPDVLTPEQYYDSRRDDSRIAPVKRLMMAVLEDALRCFQNNSDAKNGQRKRLFAEAEQWLCGEEGDGPFSFETVCETLGSSLASCATGFATGEINNSREFRPGGSQDARPWCVAVVSVRRLVGASGSPRLLETAS